MLQRQHHWAPGLSDVGEQEWYHISGLFLPRYILFFFFKFSPFTFLFMYIFIYFWLHWVFVAAHGFYLVAENRVSFLVAVHGLLLAEAFFAVEHVSRHAGFSSCSTWAVVHRLSCSVARGIFLDQGLNLWPLHWQVDVHPLYHQGSPIFFIRFKVHSKVFVE